MYRANCSSVKRLLMSNFNPMQSHEEQEHCR